MSNILKNPNLTGSRLDRHFWDKNGKTGSIEVPDDWEFDVIPQYPEDPGIIPQSLHRERGFAISAGWRKWEAGYVQRSIPLKAGQRYLAKAVIFPDVNFPGSNQVDLSAITWRFWIQRNNSDEKVFQDWQLTGQGQFKQEETILFVFHCHEDMTVDYYFKARSVWAGNTCDLHVYTLALEEVASDYGGDLVPSIGAAGTPITPSEPPTSTIPDPPPPTTGSGLNLSDVLSESDYDVIVAGLRRMEAIIDDGLIVEAFKRLADALEKMKP